MISRSTVQVFLASPMDLIAERAIVRGVLEDINAAGRRVGVAFELVAWETDVTPGAGDDAQDVVNTQVGADYDVLVCLFRDRIGTPTSRSSSGTVEEYERALLKRAAGSDTKIMVYFLAPKNPNAPHAQPELVTQLKQRMEADGILYSELPNSEALRATLYKDFNLLLVDTAKAIALKPTQNVKAATRTSTVALVDCRGRMLVVKRSPYSRIGPSLWQLPGGKIREGESARSAAKREIYEELGLVIAQERLKHITSYETANLQRQAGRLTIVLFSYVFDEAEVSEIKLNEESCDYDWLDLNRPLKHRDYLGANGALVSIMWREAHGISTLSRMLDRLKQSDGSSLCNVEEADGEQFAVLGMLNALGLVDVRETVRPSSHYARMLLEAIVSLSRVDSPLFEDGPSGWEQQLQLSAPDLKALHVHQQLALQSHRSLLALLSCRVPLPHSVRSVMDVIIFGKYQDKPYLLLRWDFYSHKYQLLSSGLEAVADESVERQANYVLERRLSSFATTLFGYVRMAEFQTRHLSAGSVDRDPIMRRYNVSVLRATCKSGRGTDFVDVLATHNELAALQIELSNTLAAEEAKELDYFEWVPLADILDSPRSYRGRSVQGVAEIIEAIGRDDFIRFADGSVPLGEKELSQASIELWQTYQERLA